MSGNLPVQSIRQIQELISHLKRFAHPQSYVVTFNNKIQSKTLLVDFNNDVQLTGEGGTDLECLYKLFSANRGLKLVITDGFTNFDKLVGMSNYLILNPDQIAEDTKSLALAITLIEDKINF